MEYSITRIAANEIEKCANILCQEYNNNILNEGWSLDNAIKLCEFYFNLQPDLFYVAKNNCEVIGFVFAFIKPWSSGNCLMIEELCVMREHRKNGVAKKLLKYLLNTSIEMYDVRMAKGETYGLDDEMPYSWYKRIGLIRGDQTYIISGNPQVIISKI